MFPGLTTKLSEGAVASATSVTLPRVDLVRISGTTSITNFFQQFGGGFSGVTFVVATDGAIILSLGGNIAKAITLAQNQVCMLVFSKATGFWYPGAIS